MSTLMYHAYDCITNLICFEIDKFKKSKITELIQDIASFYNSHFYHCHI